MTQQTYSVEELQAYIEANYHPELTCQSVEIAQQLLEREGHYEDLLEQSVIFIKENEALKAENAELKKQLTSLDDAYIKYVDLNESLRAKLDMAKGLLEEAKSHLKHGGFSSLELLKGIKLVCEALAEITK